MTMILKDGKDILLQDMVDPEALDLVYHRACFPKDSCLNLTLSVPETYIVTGVYHSSDTSDYYEFGELSVVFDNIVHCDSEFRLGKTASQDDEYIFHETTLFGNYDTSSFRNMSELRLDITIHTPDDHLSQYEELDAWYCVHEQQWRSTVSFLFLHSV